MIFERKQSKSNNKGEKNRFFDKNVPKKPNLNQNIICILCYACGIFIYVAYEKLKTKYQINLVLLINAQNESH